MVDHRYLQTMRIPLRSGRFFNAQDTAEMESSVIINETMARRLWPGREAVGEITRIGPGDWRVIGVVGDVRHSALEESAQAEMYLNVRQIDDWNAMELVVRSSRPASSLIPEVRAAIRDFDPKLPTAESKTLDQLLEDAVAPRRLITELLGFFSVVALVLASIGLYGLLAYSVTQRSREIGIRMALGAQRGDVLKMVLGQGGKLAAIGIIVGLLASLGAGRMMRALLFGVGSIDPTTLFATPCLLGVVALFACWLPAFRASRVEPIEALRD
jgi:predicted permease